MPKPRDSAKEGNSGTTLRISPWLSNVLTALVVSGVLGMATWVWNLNGRLATLEAQDARLTKLEQTDGLHWRYLSWARNHIDRLYQMNGRPIPEPPTFHTDIPSSGSRGPTQ